MAAVSPKVGLRERKKQRTRQAIVEVGTDLFVRQGYQQTTLAQIAEAADVSPSTFFNYFDTKVDVVFCLFDAEIESVEQPYEGAIRRFPAIISSAPELLAEERLRQAQLEDVLAAGFARDLGESPDGVRARVLAAIALRAMLEAWAVWFEKHASDADFQLSEALEAKAEYVMAALERGLEIVDSLPGPPEL